MSKKQGRFLIFIGLILVAFNLRAPITSVGSVIDLIQKEFSLSASSAGFITTLPLIAFALISPFVATISKRIGGARLMALGLIMILIGIGVRSYTNQLGLFIGTSLMGIGIAIGNVLVPSVIKSRFAEKIGVMTSVYVTTLCVSAALGSGVSVPLATGRGLGWSNALAIWAIVAIISIIVWLPQIHVEKTIYPSVAAPQKTANETRSIWSSPLAWWVTIFMGVQSLLFYSMVAWLPSIVISKGLTAEFAGNVAIVYQLSGIFAALFAPVLCAKLKEQRVASLAIAGIYLIGMVLFGLTKSAVLLLVAAVILSVAMGSAISFAIAFISLRSPNAQRTSELSGMSQSAGYLLAAVGPILMGALFDQFQSWTPPIFVFISFIILLGISGWFAGKNAHTFSDELL